MARTRAEFQALADVRAAEAGVLLASGMWDGVYYLVGYATECGLKACILARVDWPEVVFKDKKFAERCWTHNLVDLRRLARLDDLWRTDAPDGSALAENWKTVKDWSEESRYERTQRGDAEALYTAITDPTGGVLTWIRRHW